MSATYRDSWVVVRIFISYSHADVYWKERLMPLLKFKNEIYVRAWTDKDIGPGQQGDLEIRKELEQMDIFICLVSPYFAVSKYIQEVEMKAARRRYRKGSIEIVPIMITAPGGTECNWLKRFEYLPLKGKSWVQVREENQDYDLALQPIRDGIAAVIKRVREGGGKTLTAVKLHRVRSARQKPSKQRQADGVTPRNAKNHSR